jgi:ABC-2 type transport system ATP-binding protein
MIEAQALTKRYGKLLAVDALNLKVSPGEVYGFLGPNGAGKTSTLKMLAGLAAPDEGQAMIFGHSMHSQPDLAKAMLGYIPDRPNLFPELTAREALRLSAGLRSMDPKQAELRANALLEAFGLLPWADEPSQTFSHGMRQKLCFACALLHQPKALILDEPLVGLDPQGMRQIKALLRQLAAKGSAVLVSMHTLEVAERLCDRVGILMHGKLLIEGTVEAVMQQSGAKQSGLEEAFLALTGGASPDLGILL